MLKRTMQFTKDELEILIGAMHYTMWMKGVTEERNKITYKLEYQYKKITEQEKAIFRLPEIKK